MRKSVHDHDTYRYLELQNPQYTDWEITTIFYSACKLVDAQLVKNTKKRPSNHAERNRLVRTKFFEIHKEYYLLYRLSIMSRYDRNVGSGDKANALKWYRVIKSNLVGRTDDHE